MAVTLDDLTISADTVDCDALLNDWSWAMEEEMRPVLLTAMGDVFAQGASRAVYLIDVVSGEVARVAVDGSQFEQLLTDKQFVTDKLFPAQVVALRDAGFELGPGQVFSHKHPLVLGGQDELDNIEVTDVAVHVGVHGQIHRQVKDLPPGAPIGDIKIE